jgi:hypothetical protein
MKHGKCIINRHNDARGLNLIGAKSRARASGENPSRHLSIFVTIESRRGAWEEHPWQSDFTGSHAGRLETRWLLRKNRQTNKIHKTLLEHGRQIDLQKDAEFRSKCTKNRSRASVFRNLIRRLYSRVPSNSGGKIRRSGEQMYGGRKGKIMLRVGGNTMKEETDKMKTLLISDECVYQTQHMKRYIYLRYGRNTNELLFKLIAVTFR